MALGKNVEWQAQFSDTHAWIPTIINFIDIFVAKSQFYQIWKPLFSCAQEYPVMKDWLNQHKDRISTKELWNEDSNRTVTFANLRKWLEEKDREVEMKEYREKGKRKAPPSPQKLKTKKCDARDRPVVQRKHKKSKISRESDEESE